MIEEYPEKIIECIDEHFPKGDKRRGDALVLQAIAFIEGRELKLKEVKKVIDDEIKAEIRCLKTDEHDEQFVEHNNQIEMAEKIKRKLGLEKK